tara:strand:- start:16507 stop:16833 length:327 start_codon:yes stop_codon:yes gene_type:complete
VWPVKTASRGLDPLAGVTVTETAVALVAVTFTEAVAPPWVTVNVPVVPLLVTSARALIVNGCRAALPRTINLERLSGLPEFAAVLAPILAAVLAGEAFVKTAPITGGV